MPLVFFWILFCIVVGVWAASWNRSGIGWAVLACFISPLGAGLILLICGRRQPTRRQREEADPLAAMTRIGEPKLTQDMIEWAAAEEAARKATYGKGRLGAVIGTTFAVLLIGALIVLVIGAVVDWGPPHARSAPQQQGRALASPPDASAAWADEYTARALAKSRPVPLGN